MIRAEIEGLEDIVRVLKDMPEQVQKRVLTEGLKKAGREIRRTARDLAPKDTGKLRKNIKMVTMKKRAGKPSAVFIGLTRGAAAKLLKEAGKKGKFPYYWIPQEFGWTDKAGRRHPGHSFLRRALAQHMPTLTKSITEEFEKYVRSLESVHNSRVRARGRRLS